MDNAYNQSLGSISFADSVVNQNKSCLKNKKNSFVYEEQGYELWRIKRDRAFKEPEDDFLYKVKKDRAFLNKKVVKFDPIVTKYSFCPNNE